MSLAELGISPGKVETIEQVGHYVDDPLAAFAHLCGNKNNALLLESAEIDSKDDLQSLLMVDAALRMECRGNRVEVKALTGNGASVLPLFVDHAPDGLHIKERTDTSITLVCDEADGELDEDSRLKAASVMDALRIVINKITPIRQHPHAVFLGGVFAYDMLAGFEKLPDVAEGENDCPDFVFYLAETLITVDHQTRETHLIGSVFSGQDVAQQYFAIAQRLEAIHQQLHDMPAEPHQAQVCTPGHQSHIGRNRPTPGPTRLQVLWWNDPLGMFCLRRRIGIPWAHGHMGSRRRQHPTNTLAIHQGNPRPHDVEILEQG